MATQTFTDFDAFANVACRAEGTWLLTHPAGRQWTHTHRALRRTAFTCRHEESGSLFHGAAHPDWCILCVDTTDPPAHSLNGRQMRPNSLSVVGAGAEAYFASRTRSDWFTIVVPVDLLRSYGERHAFDAGPYCASVTTVTPPRERIDRLRRVVARLEADDHDAPWIFDDPRVVDAADRTLLAAAISCLTPAPPPAAQFRAASRPRESHGRLVRTAMERLGREPPGSYDVGESRRVAQIADAADVSERTLRSAFGDYCGVSPARYVKLRQLHLVRQALATASPADTTVTEVETLFGVSEFGRFAREYHEVFGELPSQTLAARESPRPLISETAM